MAATVENSLELDVGLVTDAIDDSGTVGELYWTRGDERIATIGYQYLPTDDELVLCYSIDGPLRDGPDEIVHEIPLETTPANLGGERTWFNCPECDSRRAKLHKPPHSDYFLCRECHDLLYESQTYTKKSLQPFEKMADVQAEIEEEGLSRDRLKQFHEAKYQSFEAVNELTKRYGHEDLITPNPVPESFEEWAEQLFHDTFETRYRRYGQCEATAKSTGERCRQPATGDHGKCYYHGGAEGSGAPEGNANAASRGRVGGPNRTA